ncbi:hypothetical protein PT281_01080 [Lactobacillus sp. ESL0701]|uniref:hypothetical protein n=1 Tax=Lactobacillus sp. ESL0701 TaxID=2983217 RepID=UPI0023F98F75|nr:hypothetical protein [Lactobacillus sp. ESL0701]MDF7671880.1 hypothetical protein [Lactobacillus sp. ESL0701]
MEKYWHLFKILFKQKTRLTYRVFGVQLVTTIVCSLMIIFTSSGAKRWELYPDYLQTVFILFSLLANLIYLGITCWQNEKFNHEQTWRLIPLHDSKLYLTNTISSGIAFIYLDLLLGIELVLISMVLYPFDEYTRQQIAAFGYWVTHLTFLKCGRLFLALLLLLLVGLAVYLTVSFLNFSSHAVVDFWSGKSHRIITWLVRLVMIVIVSWLLVISYNIWWDVAANISHFLTGSSYQDMEMTIPKINIIGDFWLFLLYNVIILPIDLGLFTRYVEAKANR